MIQTVLYVVLMLIGFGALIFIHELGHFLAAKWAGIRTEAFAVGMGPVALAWRRGIGLRLGSTGKAVDERVREYFKSSGISIDLEGGDEIERRKHLYRAMDALSIGETEYSLRWLPIGGFVKMLGQEDANPNYVSDDPRSYNMRPIGKRMVVVSAGVIMNLILAIILFVIAFVAGVRFPAPVIGDVAAIMPAGRTMPVNAAALGVTTPGLQPGDRVLSIDNDPTRTFADIHIAAAMARPGSTLALKVERAGVERPLEFNLVPEKDPTGGLLSIGVAPGSSTKLIGAGGDDDDRRIVQEFLERAGLATTGVKPGMTLTAVNDREVSAYGQLAQTARESNGQPLQTTWTMQVTDRTTQVSYVAPLNVQPDFETYRTRDAAPDDGIAGFTPLMRISRVLDDSPNKGALREGDVILRIDDVSYPRLSQIYKAFEDRRSKDVTVLVLRDGEQVPVTCHVSRGGKVGTELRPALDLMMTAQPIAEYSRYRTDNPAQTEDVTAPAGRAGLFSTGGTTILAVEGRDVGSWSEFRGAMVEATSAALKDETSADIKLLVQHPIAGSPQETVSLELNAPEVKSLHDLKWHVDLPSYLFEPLYTIRKGSPLQAIAMGFEETKKMVLMTYLTIDRLIRRSVGVDQLRGPVGIVHIGTKVMREGFIYFLFFLGMISVNLAVINFLPLPIVDGGLFLFLIYEKLKGRPPSLAFQNAATVVGLVIIGTAFVVTFYNDVLRLIG